MLSIDQRFIEHKNIFSKLHAQEDTDLKVFKDIKNSPLILNRKGTLKTSLRVFQQN